MSDPLNQPQGVSSGGEMRVIYSVERLNREIRDLLEHSYPPIWLEAEVSNFSRPASGHWYFTLKDDSAQVRCAMFRTRNQVLQFTPEHGMQVLVRARVSLYTARGEFQLIIEHMEEAGAGALQRAFEALRNKLQAEGLFEESHKQALPAAPSTIGVITSPTGAAIRDVLSVLRRRYPLAAVILYPVPVQGEAATPAIVRALQMAEQRAECDVLLLVRGGGSLEDLWAFNEEAVARAVYACPIPIVSGIGHETDFTIADFVADQRAPTPSAAAELVAPDLADWQARALQLTRRLTSMTNRQLGYAGQKQRWLQQRLQALHPGKRLEQHMQRLDELDLRLQRGLHSLLRHRNQALLGARQQLAAHNPGRRLPELRRFTAQLSQRLQLATGRQIEQQQTRLRLAARALDSLSPLKTLDRGYAIATAGDRILHDVTQLAEGDALNLRLARGGVDCKVTRIHPTRSNHKDVS